MAQNPVQNWKWVEADNGAVYGIELNSISRFVDGTVLTTTCTADNGRCPPHNWSRLWFDCRGHYRDVDHDANAMIAPPRSVIGRMADIACSNAAEIKKQKPMANVYWQKAKRDPTQPADRPSKEESRSFG